MYLRSPSRKKQRTSQIHTFPAPTAGWIANRNISTPGEGGQGAVILDNIFPTAQSAILRRGRVLYTTLEDDTRQLFSYSNGLNQKLFASTDEAIHDITISSSSNIVLDGISEGLWHVAQTATTGGVFLVGVNGEDTGFVYDGDQFLPMTAQPVFSIDYSGLVSPFQVGQEVTGGTSSETGIIRKIIVTTGTTGTLWVESALGNFAPGETITTDTGQAVIAGVPSDVPLYSGITFKNSPALTSSDMSYIWIYKSRIFFVEKNSLNAWYLPVDQIGGEATRYPFGGIFGLGGSLLYGYTWSLDSGQAGGLSEQCIFMSTEGEVAVFQGNDPSSAANWSKVGVYRIGAPLGEESFIRSGGDILVGTSIGLIPLSQAIQREIASLAPASVSWPIEEEWTKAVQQRGLRGWKVEMWPETQMVFVSPPASASDFTLFVANARTGAWCRFTNWNVRTMHVFGGNLYFGTTEGRIYLANLSGLDDEEPFTGVYLPLFDDLGAPASIKVGKLGRAVVRSRTGVNAQIELQADYDMNLPTPPSAIAVIGDNVWGSAVWGEGVWTVDDPSTIDQDWQSIGNMGYALALGVQITSGSISPLDAEIIRLDMSYTMGEAIT